MFFEWLGDGLIRLTSGEDGDYFPVFSEELDLLGLDRFFEYPKGSPSPLLWGRDVNQYVEYYRDGELVARIRKGALYREHSVEFVSDKVKRLEEIDLKALLEVNQKYLMDLTNEALDYINWELKRLSEFASAIVVSYSGGKDSQAVLDLVLQVLPPEQIYVVFTDTKMELPDTYMTVRETENFYKIKIHSVNSSFDTAELWELFGPPSRIKRWCCAVYKIAPQIKFLDRLQNSSFCKTILVFEGTRAEESTARSCQNRTSPREKTFREINVRPVFYWTSLEVYLYLFYRGLPLNPLYRKGFRRVGCSVCPFASFWSEHLIQKLYPEHAKRFLVVLENYAKRMGCKDEEEVKEYISSGAWKARSGGMGLESPVWVEIARKGSELSAVIDNCRENILEWAKTVGSVHILKDEENLKEGELRVGSAVVHFSIEKKENRYYVRFGNVEPHPVIYKKLENVIYKSAYCLHCTGCEIECPHSAVITYPVVQVNPFRCTHCGNCLEFIDRGCYVAESEKISLQTNMRGSEFRNAQEGNAMKINRYTTFGLRKSWVIGFLERLEDWLRNNILGPDQKISMKKYLIDTNLITTKSEITALGSLLSKLLSKDEKTVWQVIWVNLCINSDLFRWYVQHTLWGSVWKKDELVKKIMESAKSQERTARNAINALTNTFEESPLGEWFGRRVGKGEYYKAGTDDISLWAVGYALYKLKELKGWKGTSIREVMELTDAGPYVWFGLSKERLKTALRGLDSRKLISAELVYDLDNIHFHENVSSTYILEYALRELGE